MGREGGGGGGGGVLLGEVFKAGRGKAFFFGIGVKILCRVFR